jgi:hypothetical protein
MRERRRATPYSPTCRCRASSVSPRHFHLARRICPSPLVLLRWTSPCLTVRVASHDHAATRAPGAVTAQGAHRAHHAGLGRPGRIGYWARPTLRGLGPNEPHQYSFHFPIPNLFSEFKIPEMCIDF